MIKMMSRKLYLALVALMFSGVLVLAGCDNTGDDAAQQPPQDDTQQMQDQPADGGGQQGGGGDF